MIVRSDRFAGQQVVVNDVSVAFAPDGACLGIVAHEGGLKPLMTPEPLREQDIEVMRQLPGLFSVEDRTRQGSAARHPRPGDVDALTEAHTRDELVAMAEQRGLAVPARANKRQIAEMLLAAGE